MWLTEAHITHLPGFQWPHSTGTSFFTQILTFPFEGTFISKINNSLSYTFHLLVFLLELVGKQRRYIEQIKWLRAQSQFDPPTRFDSATIVILDCLCPQVTALKS